MSKESSDKFEVKRDEDLEIKLYKTRWVVLGVFTLFAACNAIQWLEYSIIANIIVKYYGVSVVAVDWTSIIAMALYPIFLLPASFSIDKIGIRFCIMFGVIGTTIGAWIKIFSVQPHLFWVTFLGQAVVFACQSSILSLPPKIAAIWFGPNEVSTACGIGIAGTQLGTALSFILPPLIVKNHDNLEDIGRELSYLFYSVAIFCTVIMILIFIFFKGQPPLPPSRGQAEIRTNKLKFSNKGFWTSYKELITDKHFMLQANSYGINLGVYIAICTMLNQFILEYFENGEKDAGTIGLLTIILGFVGIITFGPILDKTKKYRENTLALYGMTILGVGAFMVALETKNKIFVYASACFYGFFLSAYYTVGIEFGVELSYPHPESSSSGIMVSIVQVYGVIFTLLLGQLYAKFGTFWALASMIVSLVLGGIMAVFVPGKLLRQEALKSTPETKTFLAKNVETKFM